MAVPQVKHCDSKIAGKCPAQPRLLTIKVGGLFYWKGVRDTIGYGICILNL